MAQFWAELVKVIQIIVFWVVLAYIQVVGARLGIWKLPPPRKPTSSQVQQMDDRTELDQGSASASVSPAPDSLELIAPVGSQNESSLLANTDTKEISELRTEGKLQEEPAESGSASASVSPTPDSLELIAPVVDSALSEHPARVAGAEGYESAGESDPSERAPTPLEMELRIKTFDLAKVNIERKRLSKKLVRLEKRIRVSEDPRNLQEQWEREKHLLDQLTLAVPVLEFEILTLTTEVELANYERTQIAIAAAIPNQPRQIHCSITLQESAPSGSETITGQSSNTGQDESSLSTLE